MDQANTSSKTLPSVVIPKKSHNFKAIVKQKIESFKEKFPSRSTKIIAKKDERCRLLDLPPELRLYIFKLALSDLPEWLAITLAPPSLVYVLWMHFSMNVRREIQEAYEYWIPRTTYIVSTTRKLPYKLEFKAFRYEDTIRLIESVAFVYDDNLSSQGLARKDLEARLVSFIKCTHLVNLRHINVIVKRACRIPMMLLLVLKGCKGKFPRLEVIEVELQLPKGTVKKGDGREVAAHYWEFASHTARQLFDDEGVEPVGKWQATRAGRWERFRGFENLSILHRWELDPEEFGEKETDQESEVSESG